MAAAFALSLTACADDIPGPGNGNGETGSVDFYVGNPGGASSAITASVAGAAAPVDPDQIASLEIVFDLMEAHVTAPGGSASTTTPWVEIPVDPPVTIDPATLAAGEFQLMTTVDVPAGDYDHLRLYPQTVTVQFQTSSSTTPITIGNHDFDPAPATHDVTVPSGRIQIPTAHLTVDEGGGVVVMLWDVDETAASVIATGSGMILLRPVFVEGGEDLEDEVADGG